MTTDERVERVAAAMYDQSPEVWFSNEMDTFPSWEDAPVYVKAGARIMATAAIAALDADPVEDVLNRLWDAMPRPEQAVIALTRNEDGMWFNVAVLDEATMKGERLMRIRDEHHTAHGAGTSAVEAIRNAVKAAGGER